MVSAGDSTKYQYKVTAVGDNSESSSTNIATTYGYVPDPGKIAINPGEVIIQSAIPDEFGLRQNYPNPFNPATTIEYRVAEDALVRISIYDIQGKFITQLVNSHLSAGFYSVRWDARNQPSGVYLCKMEARGHVSVRKLMLIK